MSKTTRTTSSRTMTMKLKLRKLMLEKLGLQEMLLLAVWTSATRFLTFLLE